MQTAVIVKTASQLAAVVAENPYERIATDPSRLLIGFTREQTANDELAVLKPLVQSEQLCVGVHATYLWCANGILECKAAAAMLGKVGKITTTRNWATVLKLDAMLG